MIFKELPSFNTLLESSERYSELDIKTCVAWLHVVHAGSILRRCLERDLREQGLSYGRFIVLALLACASNGIRVGKLAEMSCVTTPTVSNVISNMERDGLISRAFEPDDRRIVRVVLTPDGREAMNKIAPLFFKNQQDSMSTLEDDEIHSLCLLLSKINLEA